MLFHSKCIESLLKKYERITDKDYSQQSRGRKGKIRSETFRHFFATLHLRCLSHIFNRTACIYHTATRLDLPRSRITISLINDLRLFFVCLLDDLITNFCYFNFDMGNQWTQIASTIILVLQANRLKSLE